MSSTAKTYEAPLNPCKTCGGTKRYVKGLTCFNCNQRRRAEHKDLTISIETNRAMHRQRAHVKLLINPYEDVTLDYWDRAL